MSDVFDRLLRSAYEAGKSPFTSPFGRTPFRFPQGRINAPMARRQPELPVEEVERPLPPPPEAPLPSKRIMAPSTTYVPLKDEEEEAKSKEEQREGVRQAIMAAMYKGAYPEWEQEQSWWQKALNPLLSGLLWMEKIDASSYGVVKAGFLSVFTGRSFRDILEQDEGQSVWEAAREHVHGQSGWEQFFGEVLLSPFNLIPVGTIGNFAGKSLGRVCSSLARTQVMGETPRWALIRYSQQGLRARVSQRLADTMGDVLSKPTVYGEWNALNQYPIAHWGVIKRLRAIADSASDDLTIKTPAVKELGKFMNDPDAWLKSYEMKEIGGYFTATRKGLEADGIPWSSFWNDLMLPQRTPKDVEREIYQTITRYASPVTKRTETGGIASKGVIAGSSNWTYTVHRKLVQQLTPFYLLTRPAYTVNNQMMNFSMLTLRHPMLTMKYLMSPNMRKEVQAIWGMIQPPTYLYEGFGHSYITALEAIDAGEELLEVLAKDRQVTLPLIGTGQFNQARKEIMERYMEANVQRPFVEAFSPMKRVDSWVRGINVAGEQYFRSANFVFTHYKTYHKMMDNLCGKSGMQWDNLITMSKNPESLRNYIAEGAFNVRDLVNTGNVSPAFAAIVQRNLAELPADHTILDVVGALKASSKTFEKELREIRLMMELHSGPGVVHATNELMEEMAKKELMIPGIETPENLKIFLQEHPEQKKFWEHVQARPWKQPEARFIDEVGNPFMSDVYALQGRVDDVYRNKVRTIAANAYDQYKKLVKKAEATGTQPSQKDINAIFGKMSTDETTVYDVWVRRRAELYDEARAKAKALGKNKVSLSDLDTKWTLSPEDAKEVLSRYGLEDMVDGGDIDPLKMLDTWEQGQHSKSMNLIDDTVERWREQLADGRRPTMDWGSVDFLKAGDASRVREDVIIKTLSLESMEKTKKLVEQLPIEIRHSIKSIEYVTTKRVAPAGLYNPRTRGILITDEMLDNPRVFFHEIGHDVFLNKLSDPTTVEDFMETFFRTAMDHPKVLKEMYRERGWSTELLQDWVAKSYHNKAFRRSIKEVAEVEDLFSRFRTLHASSIDLVADVYKSLGKQSQAEILSIYGRYGKKTSFEKWLRGEFLHLSSPLEWYADSFGHYCSFGIGKLDTVFGRQMSDYFLNTMPKRLIPGAPETLRYGNLQTMHNSAMSYAYREGIRTAEGDLFNYGMRTNLDWALSTLMPYPFWPTRFALNFGIRACENPRQLNALVVLMNQWQQQAEDLPGFLMASPLKITMPDGTQLRFSPFQWLFPLGYTGFSFMRYGDQVDDLADALHNIQDFTGGYLFPTWELLAGLTSQFGAPFYESRGVGVARDPYEVLRDFVPQLRLLRGSMGVSPWVAKNALEHHLVPDRDIMLAVRAIGEAVNEGEITPEQGDKAAEALYDRRPDPIALQYLSKSASKIWQTDLARYMGLPISLWRPEQQESFRLQQLMYNKNEAPVRQEMQQGLEALYPGMEVIRGNLVPAGLRKREEEEWKASREYYQSVENAKALRDEELTELQAAFDNPQIGATVSPNEYISRRRSIYDRYLGGVRTSNVRADELGAPITSEQREEFWRRVGRQVWPSDVVSDYVEKYYQIEADLYPSSTGDIDWEEFFKAKEGFLASLPLWLRQLIEETLDNPSAPDYDYRMALKVTKPYWSLKDVLISRDEELYDLAEQISYYDVVDRNIAKVLRQNPRYVRMERDLKVNRERMRRANPQLEAALQRYWG